MAVVGSFFINTALSIGANLVSSWLNPKKKEKITPEDVPQLGQGSDIILGFGLFISPGNLLYTVSPSLAGHGDDRSSFGVLGIANPSPDCELIAMRVNNILAASKSPIFPITEPNVTGIYTDSNGLSVKNGLNFNLQNFNTLNNADFAKNGFPGLKYEGLTYAQFISCDRQRYGGFNSRISFIYKNKATSTSIVPFSVKGDDTVIVTIGQTFGDNSNNFGLYFSRTYAHGFFGTYHLFAFDSVVSRGIIAVSGGREELLITTDPFPPLNNPVYAFGSITPDIPLAIPGSGLIPVNASSYTQPLTSNRVTFSRIGGDLQNVILTNPAPLPFKSVGNNIYDGNNNIIYSDTQRIICFGWDNRYFYLNTIYDSENTSLIIPGFPLPSGTTQKTSTSLASIIQELLQLKGVLINNNFLNESTFQEVRGYSCTLDSVDDKIINLCTAYGKFIFQDGNGDYILIDYPANTPYKEFFIADLLVESSTTVSPEISQPDQIQFTYKSINDQLSQKIVHVGYNNISNNTSDLSLDLSCNETEAKIIAWNTLLLRSHTNINLKFRSEKGIDRAGRVIRFENQLFLVANLEIGADATFDYNCVNYVNLNDGFTEYMLQSSNKLTQVTAKLYDPFLIPTETTNKISNSTILEGGLFYTNSNVSTSFQTDNGNINPVRTIIPATGGFLGDLISFKKDFDYIEITVFKKSGMPLSNGLLRIGLSWVSYQNFTIEGDNYIFTGIIVGRFSSSPILKGGSFVAQINNNNFAEGYLNQSPTVIPKATQNGINFPMLSFPDELTLDPIPSFGQVTTEFPYGYPCSGILTASAITSYFAGITSIWLTKPGGENKNFYLENAEGYSEVCNERWFLIKPTFTMISLGLLNSSSSYYKNPGHFEYPGGFNNGSYRLIQAKSNFNGFATGLHDKGSFIFIGNSQ